MLKRNVNILLPSQDNDPELSEVFLISLVSVTLVGSNGDVPPSTGANNQAQVTVLPNDNPEGILTFRESRYASVHFQCDSSMALLHVW